jgi:general secretion pathway protein N
MFAAALVVLLPMRLALGWFAVPGFGVGEASGSVWHGRLMGVRFGAIPLGDVSARLAVLPLLTGRARLALHGENFEGALGAGRDGVGLENVTARIAVGDRLAPVPIGGLELSGVTVRFHAGRCVLAEGRVRAVLRGGVAGVALPGGLGGTARCESGALVLPLASQSGLERFTVSIDARGRYRASIAIRSTQPAGDAGLLASGFTRAGADYVRGFGGAL